MSRFPWPERGEIRLNGKRQYLEEDLDYLLALVRDEAYHRTVWRVDEDPKRLKHAAKLSEALSRTYAAFLKKWNKP